MWTVRGLRMRHSFLEYQWRSRTHTRGLAPTGTIFNRIQSFPTLGVLRDLIQVWYRVDVVDVKQEREGNKATAKYVAWPSCAWLLLSFFLFPVRHPLCIKCHSEPIWLQTKTVAISNKSQYPMVLISDKHCTPQRIPRPSNIITLAGGSVKLQSATDSLRSIHLLLLREISFSSFFKGTTYTNNEWRD